MNTKRLLYEAFLVSLSTVSFDIFLDYLRKKKHININYTMITITRFIMHLIFGYIGLSRLYMYVLV